MISICIWSLVLNHVLYIEFYCTRISQSIDYRLSWLHLALHNTVQTQRVYVNTGLIWLWWPRFDNLQRYCRKFRQRYIDSVCRKWDSLSAIALFSSPTFFFSSLERGSTARFARKLALCNRRDYASPRGYYTFTL